MKTLEYKVKDKNGIHARPAGTLVSAAKQFDSDITVSFGEKTADLKKIFAVMSLGVGFGDVITFSFEGSDEDTAASTINDTLLRTGL